MAKRILLVDDEPLIIKGLKYTLEQEGYETLAAYDGEEALEVFFANTVDLVLLDLCDTIYMLKGWEQSCGANREYGYALAKGLDIMFER